MKLAVCVPSFGHRHTDLFQHMNERAGEKYDMFVFIQDNDPDNKLYYEDDFENVKIIQSGARGISENRQQIIDYCLKNGYNKIVMCDDDMGVKAGMIDASCKRETSNSYRKKTIDMFDLFDKLVDASVEYDAGMVGVPHDVYLGFSTPGKVSINRSCSVCGLILIDLDKTFRKFPELHYSAHEDNLNEDVDLAIQMRQNNITIVTVRDYGYNVARAYAKSVCFPDSHARYMAVFNTAKKWKLVLKTDTNFHLQLRVRWDKYENHTIPEPRNPFEKKLYELYETNAPFDEVYEYVNSFNKKLKK